MHNHTLETGAKTSRELAGTSHALSVSEPEAVATVLDAVAST